MSNSWTTSVSSHYAQAYIQSPPTSQQPSNHYTQASTSTSRPMPSGNSSWYQPGNLRCNHKSCTFNGSAKAVEIHKMDRHLIYPPGWDKRTNEWDADPSLKGKPIPIQGTNLILDTPDALEAWIAERKRRWPSATRVEDKKRKVEEATARGELTPEQLGIFSKKRPRTDNQQERPPRGRGRGRARGAERGRGRGAFRGRGGPPPAADPQSSSSGSDVDDAEPEVVSSKVVAVPETNTIVPLRSTKPPPRHPPQVRAPAQTTSHSGLLRNLLLPEIRMTVSNLSQAIHFLVENDFLVDVELKPGEAQDQKIQVIEEDSKPQSISYH